MKTLCSVAVATSNQLWLCNANVVANLKPHSLWIIHHLLYIFIALRGSEKEPTAIKNKKHTATCEQDTFRYPRSNITCYQWVNHVTFDPFIDVLELNFASSLKRWLPRQFGRQPKAPKALLEDWPPLALTSVVRSP